MKIPQYETLILGAGASGMMCAARLTDKKSVAILERNDRVGAKIAVSGGGRCNLTNRRLDLQRYRGERGFIQTVLKRYDQRWLRRWFDERGVQTRLEKGDQYFCVQKAEGVNRALSEAIRGVRLHLGSSVAGIERRGEGFLLHVRNGESIAARRLVVASGGLSYPRLGASDIGLRIAEVLGHRIVRPAPALVGWTLQPQQAFFKSLSGISAEVELRVGDRRWKDRILFAHRGLSGPAVLNASLWRERGEVSIDFLPGVELRSLYGERKQISTLLPLPRRLARALLEHLEIPDRPARELDAEGRRRLEGLHDYRFAPAGDFGYGRAEVTRGGVDTREVDPYSMESRRVKGLYFVGEVLDVTGEVGGFNFQWAFSSAAVCADAINQEG